MGIVSRFLDYQTQYISHRHGTSSYLPDIDIEVAHYTAAVSTRQTGDKHDLQSHSPVLEPPCRDGRELWLPQFLHLFLASRAAMRVQKLVLKLLHRLAWGHLTGAGERRVM